MDLGFIDPPLAGKCDLGTDLHLDAEIVAAYGERFENRTREHLVAHLDVRKGLIVQDIEGCGDQPIGQVVMKIQGAMRLAVESRTVDHVRNATTRNQIVHDLPVGRVVLQIGILDDDHIACANRHRCANSAALAFVDVMKDKANRALFAERTLRGRLRASRNDLTFKSRRPKEALKHSAGAILGAVINQDQLFVDVLQGIADKVHHCLYRLDLVVDRHQDR